MGGIISVDATTGKFLMDLYEYEKDLFETGLAYNTSGLEIQVTTNDGGFYRYTVGSAIKNAVAPDDDTEINFIQLDANAWTAMLQMHTSIFSGLDIAAGESIGNIKMQATGFGAVSKDFGIAKPIATDSNGYVRLSANGLDSITTWTVDINGTVGGVDIADILADTDELQQEWESGGTLYNILGGKAGQMGLDDLAARVGRLSLSYGTIGDTGNSTTIVHLDNLDYPDDVLVDLLLVLVDDSAGSTPVSAWITDWDNTAKVATVEPALPFTPQDGADQYTLFAIRRDVLSTTTGIDADTANKIADHVRRRSQANVEASSDGDALSIGSLYGLIQQGQESNTEDNVGFLTIYQTDGTTELAQRALATDSGAVPVVGIS